MRRPLKEGIGGERRPKDRVILRITLLYFTLSLLNPHMLRVKHSSNAGTHRFYVSREVDTYFHNQTSSREKMKLLCFRMQQCLAFQGVLRWDRPSWADPILHRWKQTCFHLFRWKLMKNYNGNVVG